MYKEEKSVLITGSSKGLGKALAQTFADNGYNVFLHGRDKYALAKVQSNVIERGVDCFILRGNINSSEFRKKMVRAAAKGNVSVFINNAAVLCPNLPLEKIDDRQIENIFATNLISLVKLTRDIYKLFINNKKMGVIINIGSVSGIEAQKMRTVYGASKWALRGFTDILRIEAKKHKIRIVGIYPAKIKTRSDCNYGIDVESAAKKIFELYANSAEDEIILNNNNCNSRS